MLARASDALHENLSSMQLQAVMMKRRKKEGKANQVVEVVKTLLLRTLSFLWRLWYRALAPFVFAAEAYSVLLTRCLTHIKATWNLQSVGLSTLGP